MGSEDLVFQRIMCITECSLMKILVGLLLVANIIAAVLNFAHCNFIIGGLNVAAAVLLTFNILEME